MDNSEGVRGHLGETNVSGVEKMDTGTESALECIQFAMHVAGKGI